MAKNWPPNYLHSIQAPWCMVWAHRQAGHTWLRAAGSDGAMGRRAFTLWKERLAASEPKTHTGRTDKHYQPLLAIPGKEDRWMRALAGIHVFYK